MIAEQQRLEKELEAIQNKMRELPDGKLICVHNGDYIKWHQSDGHHITYIPKNNRELAEQLAMKKYLFLKEEELQKEQAAIRTYLQQCESENKAEDLFEIPEYALQLGESTVFPDFTIRHPQTKQYYYWEHFGMMDNDSYSTKALSKLRLYTANEIFPSIQLITTYETKDQPLDSAFVEMLIKYYFL